ncbi:hypothetical protein AGLY_012139 [Aphis glycines]|uniref:Uncharacterized protein n=1 Tax=Aphis glycines TaxID=307491 RepID=A0A6G0TBE8_APHGL|nr:hypothetical protein AGLY_012139 [Aphis glycines]
MLSYCTPKFWYEYAVVITSIDLLYFTFIVYVYQSFLAIPLGVDYETLVRLCEQYIIEPREISTYQPFINKNFHRKSQNSCFSTYWGWTLEPRGNYCDMNLLRDIIIHFKKIQRVFYVSKSKIKRIDKRPTMMSLEDVNYEWFENLRYSFLIEKISQNIRSGQQVVIIQTTEPNNYPLVNNQQLRKSEIYTNNIHCHLPLNHVRRISILIL